MKFSFSCQACSYLTVDDRDLKLSQVVLCRWIYKPSKSERSSGAFCGDMVRTREGCFARFASIFGGLRPPKRRAGAKTMHLYRTNNFCRVPIRYAKKRATHTILGLAPVFLWMWNLLSLRDCLRNDHTTCIRSVRVVKKLPTFYFNFTRPNTSFITVKHPYLALFSH